MTPDTGKAGSSWVDASFIGEVRFQEFHPVSARAPEATAGKRTPEPLLQAGAQKYLSLFLDRASRPNLGGEP